MSLSILLMASLLQAAAPQAPETPAADVTDAANDGVVVLECRVLSNGHVTGCVILSEDPPGQGFGQAALDAARRARLSPGDTRASRDNKVRFTTRFRLQD